jgi:hypothetical protein
MELHADDDAGPAVDAAGQYQRLPMETSYEDLPSVDDMEVAAAAAAAALEVLAPARQQQDSSSEEESGSDDDSEEGSDEEMPGGHPAQVGALPA